MASHSSADRPPQDSILAWMAEARAGSNTALGQLLEAYRPYLLGIANDEVPNDLRGKVGGSDLVQQTFLEAKKDISRFQGTTEAELIAWLRQILDHNLANVCRQYRTQKRQVEREQPLEQTDLARNASPGAVLQQQEREAALNRVLARLTEEQRIALHMRNRERRSFFEVGQALGKSAEAARKIWARAVERLEEEMGPYR